MPYINKDHRERIAFIDYGNARLPMARINYEQIYTAGELQYAIAVMIKDYIGRKGLNYQNCNDIMGALAGAQQEFYRRTVAPYEDLKIKENGDV